jgi:hypothetical protein
MFFGILRGFGAVGDSIKNPFSLLGVDGEEF